MAYNLIGQKFGRLTVIADNNERRGTARVKVWECRCECGKITNVGTSDLRSGHTVSCGCYHDEIRGKSSATHNMTNTPIYRIWKHMKSRCFNPHNNRFELYAGRGITVCDKWLSFEGFMEDMGETYKPGLSIERLDNNGNYCKDNCKWANDIIQANNKSNTILVTLNGKTDTLQNLCRTHNVEGGTIKYRLRKGLTPEQAFSLPVTNSTFPLNIKLQSMS